MGDTLVRKLSKTQLIGSSTDSVRLLQGAPSFSSRKSRALTMCYTLRWGKPSLGLTGGKNETLVEQSRAMFIVNVSKYKSSEEKRHRLWVSKP